MLCHYLFPSIFWRCTKKCFVSIVSPDIVELAKSIQGDVDKISYNAIRLTLRRASERLRTAAETATASSSSETSAFNREIAGAITNIQDVTNSMIADLDTLFITALASNEKITMVAELVIALPQVAENREVATRILQRLRDFDNRIEELTRRVEY